MNDSLRTNLFVRFPPETIACACIFLAARELKVCVFIWLENYLSVLCYLTLVLALTSGSSVPESSMVARVWCQVWRHWGTAPLMSPVVHTHQSSYLASLVPTAFGFTVCKHTERRHSRFGIRSDTQRKHMPMKGSFLQHSSKGGHPNVYNSTHKDTKDRPTQ